MDDSLVNFGAYSKQFTYKELLLMYPGYCQAALEEQFKTTSKFLDYLSNYRKYLPSLKFVRNVEEIDTLDLKKILLCLFPNEWIQTEEIDRVVSLQLLKQDSVRLNIHKQWIQSDYVLARGLVYCAEHVYYPLNVFSNGTKETGRKTHTVQVSKVCAQDLSEKLLSTCSYFSFSEQVNIIRNNALTIPLIYQTKDDQSIDIYSSLPEYEMFLDTETTGLPKKYWKASSFPDHSSFPTRDFDPCRLLEVAWVIRKKDTQKVMDRVCLLVKLNNFSVDVYDKKLYNECLNRGKEISLIWRRLFRSIYQYPRLTLVCHNCAFDRSVIASELAREKCYPHFYHTWTTLPFCCTMVQATPFVHQPPKWPKLQYLYSFLTNKQIIQTHRALEDVDMLIECYDIMKNKNWIG